jgi:hypothetical protein
MINNETKQKILNNFDLSDFSDSEIDEIINHSYMATQYESGGSIDFDGYLREVFRDNYDLSDSDYFDYTIEELNEIVCNNDDIGLKELLDGYSTETIVRKVYFGKYYINDRYVTFDGYGNLKSFNSLEQEYDEDDIIDFVIENNSQDYDEVQFVIDNQDLINDISLFLVGEGY